MYKRLSLCLLLTLLLTACQAVPVQPPTAAEAAEAEPTASIVSGSFQTEEPSENRGGTMSEGASVTENSAPGSGAVEVTLLMEEP